MSRFLYFLKIGDRLLSIKSYTKPRHIKESKQSRVWSGQRSLFSFSSTEPESTIQQSLKLQASTSPRWFPAQTFYEEKKVSSLSSPFLQGNVVCFCLPNVNKRKGVWTRAWSCISNFTLFFCLHEDMKAEEVKKSSVPQSGHPSTPPLSNKTNEPKEKREPYFLTKHHSLSPHLHLHERMKGVHEVLFKPHS